MDRENHITDPATVARTFYGKWARLYDTISRSTPWIARIRRDAVHSSRIRSGDTVVDMGCGSGANLEYIADRVGRQGTVIGIDFTDGLLRRADIRIRDRDNVHLVRGDVTELPIDGPVDVITSTFVLGMLSDPASAIDGWFKILSDGGTITLVDLQPSESRFGRYLNPVFELFVVCSTPPTRRLRYPFNPLDRLEERVLAGHQRLREHLCLTDVRTRAAGFVTMSVGIDARGGGTSR